jgi:hypothetical protein
MRSQRLTVLLAAGLLVAAGWIARDLASQTPAAMDPLFPAAHAGDIYGYDLTSKPFYLWTTNDDGTRMTFWHFRGAGGMSDTPPELQNSKTFTAR